MNGTLTFVSGVMATLVTGAGVLFAFRGKKLEVKSTEGQALLTLLMAERKERESDNRELRKELDAKDDLIEELRAMLHKANNRIAVLEMKEAEREGKL